MVKYRDIGHIIPTILQLGMYVTPVAWSTVIVPGEVSVGSSWSTRSPACWTRSAGRCWRRDPLLAGAGLFARDGLAGLLAGAIVFKQQERNFADVI